MRPLKPRRAWLRVLVLMLAIGGLAGGCALNLGVDENDERMNEEMDQARLTAPPAGIGHARLIAGA